MVVGGLASGGTRPGDHSPLRRHRRAARGRGRRRPASGRARTPWCRRGACRSGPTWSSPTPTDRRCSSWPGCPRWRSSRRSSTALEPAERALAVEGLLAGLVIDENTPDYERGDFLVRPIHGGDRESGALVLGENARVGQTMRFHVRDAGSADEDLRAALRAARASSATLPGRRPAVQLQRAGHAHVRGPQPRRRGDRPGALGASPSPACSATARSGRCTVAASYTGTPQRWSCSRTREHRVCR